MSLNPEPLGIVADDDERALSSLMAWRRSATRADKLRVWLALGGSRADFDAEHPPADRPIRVKDTSRFPPREKP